MKCPFCGSHDTRVTDSRPIKDGSGIRRRRECPVCSERFTTYEHMEFETFTVVKKDGHREEFSRLKLFNGLRKACEKRSVSEETIEQTVDEIIAELQKRAEKEVPASAIGNLVLRHLHRIDHVAYIRFASVYKEFQSLGEFREALEGLEALEAKASK